MKAFTFGFWQRSFVPLKNKQEGNRAGQLKLLQGKGPQPGQKGR